MSRMLFAGDICFGYSDFVIGSKYSSDYISDCKDIIMSCDYRLANLENPITSNNHMIKKTGVALKSDTDAIAFLSEMKLDCVSIANNHIGDFGENGIKDTIEILEENQIEHIGAGKGKMQAFQPVHFQDISIVAICENEFGITHNTEYGAAGYDEKYIGKIIRYEVENGYKVIVFFHGGYEGNPVPTPGCKLRFHKMIDEGAAAIVSTHTHCPQGIELYKNAPIVYSLGNFNFYNPDMYDPTCPWYFGYMLILKTDESVSIEEVVPYHFDVKASKISLLHNDEKKMFMDHLNDISDCILDDEKLQHYFWGLCYEKKNYYKNTLKRIKWESEKTDDFLEIKNMFNCETHNETMAGVTRIYTGEYDLGECVTYTNNLRKLSHVTNNINMGMELTKKNNIYFSLPLTSEKKYAIWGSGKLGVYSLKAVMDAGGEVLFFIDRNAKNGEYFVCNKNVLTMEKANISLVDSIIIAISKIGHDEKEEIVYLSDRLGKTNLIIASCDRSY